MNKFIQCLIFEDYGIGTWPPALDFVLYSKRFLVTMMIRGSFESPPKALYTWIITLIWYYCVYLRGARSDYRFE